MINPRICPKCGTAGQWELQHDNDGNVWQIECRQCSKIVQISKEDVPKGLNPRQYEIPDMKSTQEASTTFSIAHLGINPPRVMWGNRGSAEL